MIKMKKYTIAFTWMLCMLCSITGCGKKPSASDALGQMEENATGEEHNQENDTSGESAIAFYKGGLPASLGMENDKWKDSFAVDAAYFKEVEIDVTVQLPDTDHMSVADLEVNTDFSGATEALIAKLFDDGKAGALAEGQYPKWKLEELVKEYEQSVAYWENAVIEEEWEKELAKENQDQLEQYRSQLRKATNDIAATASYEGDRYWGEVDGKTWELVRYDYWKNEYGFDAGLVDKQEGLVTQLEGDVEDLYMDTVYSDVENACTISKEQAIRQAENYLSEMGYSEYEVREAKSIQWIMDYAGDEVASDEESSDTFVEGYTVYFGRAIDGVQVSTGNYMLYTSDGEVESCYSDEIAQVDITDAGVIGFRVQCPRKLKTDSVTETSLLSFDRIQSRIRECIEQKAAEGRLVFYGGNVLKLDHMDLTYLVLTGDVYTVIPVWRIYIIQEIDSACGVQAEPITHHVVLNAIDGSEIDLADIYYEAFEGEAPGADEEIEPTE